jgi:hypothetical protein
MKRLAALAGAVALSLAATGAQAGSSVASQAMQCYTIYDLMMEKNPSDPYRNNVLGSQSVLMGTIYVMNAGTMLKPVSKEDFDSAHAFTQKALLTMAKTDRESFVQKLINCEGWREEVLTVLALGMEEVPKETSMEVAQQILRDLAKPRAEYPLKGVSYADLNQVVDQAISQHLK